jgi:hypothetical protein
MIRQKNYKAPKKAGSVGVADSSEATDSLFDSGGMDEITVRRKKIPVRTASVKHLTLRFFPQNPRIYSLVWGDGDEEPSQEEIFDALSKMEHVRETLVPSIRQNGGLIEPLLVRGNVVLEGNSRLAAYRLLAQTDPAKWGEVRVRILPDTMTDSEISTLLGQYHIVGKKDWQPYEQAGHLYRRCTKDGVTEEEIRTEVGLSLSRIRHLIRVYGFMVKQKDHNPNRWSYYDELLKGRKFNKAREAYPDFDEIIVEKIQSGDIERAVDLRDQLPLVTTIGGNTLKKFITGKLSFAEAVQDARHRGAGDYNYKKLHQFRQWIAEDVVETEFVDALPDERKRLKFELDKIQRRVAALVKKLE